MIVHHITADPDSGQVRTENYVVEFEVANDCTAPPQPAAVPDEVLVGSKCDTCPQEACPGDQHPGAAQRACSPTRATPWSS